MWIFKRWIKFIQTGYKYNTIKKFIQVTTGNKEFYSLSTDRLSEYKKSERIKCDTPVMYLSPVKND